MKIPIVQADVNVDGGYSARGIPASAFATGAVAAGEVARAGETVMYTLAREQREVNRLAAQKQAADTQAEAIYLQSQAEIALQNHDAALRPTATDGPAYLEARRKAFEDTVAEVSKRAKNPGAAALFQQHMTQRLRRLDGQALDYASDLTKRSEVAQLTTTLDNYDQILAGTDWRDTGRIAEVNALKEAAIDVRAPTLGVDVAEAKKIQERKKSTEEIAYRHSQDDPGDFISSLSRYRGMDGEKLDRLKTSAQQRLDAAGASRNQEMERYYKQVEAEAEGERQAQLTLLDEKARARTLTTEDLRLARVFRTVKTPAEYDHLAALINAPPDRPSDPDTKRIIGADVYSLSPRTRDVDIRAAMAAQARGGRGLNTEDGLQFINRLRENEQRRDDKAHSLRGERYRAAKEEGYKRLGLVGAFETLNPQAKKLLADFDADLNARTDWLNANGRDSIAVLHEILPRYLNAQSADAKLNYDAQLKTIDPRLVGDVARFGGPDITAEKGWEAWYQGAAQKVEALKGTDPSLYASQKLALQNLREARKRMLEHQQRIEATPPRQTPAAPPPPTPGPTPPRQRTPVDMQ